MVERRDFCPHYYNVMLWEQYYRWQVSGYEFPEGLEKALLRQGALTVEEYGIIKVDDSILLRECKDCTGCYKEATDWEELLYEWQQAYSWEGPVGIMIASWLGFLLENSITHIVE